MLLLAIDTAGPDCAVALARREAGGAAIVASMSERIGRGHAERLMPMIEQALHGAGLDFADLDRIAVTTGPGSFTGVRVGIAAARGLALALDVAAIGIGSLEAHALPVLRTCRAGTVVAVLDAKRGEVYALARDVAGEVRIGPTAIRPADLVAQLAGASHPLLLTGSGAAAIAALFGGEAEIVGTSETPDIDDVAELGFATPGDGAPVPLYLRGADAKPQHDKAVAHR